MEEIPVVAQEILNRVDALCDKLGIAGDALWAMCMRQVNVEVAQRFVALIVPLVLFAVATVSALFIRKKFLLSIKHDDEARAEREEKDIREVCSVAQGFIVGISAIVFVCLLYRVAESFTFLMNREYYALKNLEEIIKSIV